MRLVADSFFVCLFVCLVQQYNYTFVMTCVMANYVMLKSDRSDGFFYLHLTPMKDIYYLFQYTLLATQMNGVVKVGSASLLVSDVM